MPHQDLDPALRAQLGRRIDAARKKQGLTLVQLADRAGYDERTIRNVVKGLPTRLKTLHEICKAVEIGLDLDDGHKSGEISDEAHGSYTRIQFDDYLGIYFVTRRSYTTPTNLIRSICTISWNHERACLSFYEKQRYQAQNRMIDYSQGGDIYVCSGTGLLHLLTLDKGALRLMTVTKLRIDDMTMHGIALTQVPQKFYYQPSTSPIYFKKIDPALPIEQLETRIGPIGPSHSDYREASSYLAEVERNIGIFALLPMAPKQDL